ncbi:MAG: response regulator [Chloroflexi bacterium]|nr:response regulator [Chloroflexota bacterium]
MGPHPLAAVPEPGPTRRGGTERQGEAAAEAEQLLGVARRLVELHGGTFRILADDGSGEEAGRSQTITLDLPAAQVVKVLVVDDSTDLVRLFRRYLAGTGYQLLSARTAAGALRLAAQARPDLIILDVLLPAQDGWEILGALQATPETRGIPIIMCSILPERALALALGVADYLPKPVSQQRLLETLARYAPGPTSATR